MEKDTHQEKMLEMRERLERTCYEAALAEQRLFAAIERLEREMEQGTITPRYKRDTLKKILPAVRAIAEYLRDERIAENQTGGDNES